METPERTTTDGRVVTVIDINPADITNELAAYAAGCSFYHFHEDGPIAVHHPVELDLTPRQIAWFWETLKAFRTALLDNLQSQTKP